MVEGVFPCRLPFLAHSRMTENVLHCIRIGDIDIERGSSVNMLHLRHQKCSFLNIRLMTEIDFVGVTDKTYAASDATDADAVVFSPTAASAEAASEWQKCQWAFVDDSLSSSCAFMAVR